MKTIKTVVSQSKLSLWSFLCFVALYTLNINALAQTPISLTIGNISGTGSYVYGPLVRPAVGGITYSRHAYLYTAAELGIPFGASIIKMEWLKKDVASVNGNNIFNVWVNNTNATSLPSSTWGSLISGATQVYSSNTFSVPNTATFIGEQFNLTPNDHIIYAGGNLQILTDWTKVGVSLGAVNFYTSAAGGKSIGFASGSALTNSTTLTTGGYGNNRPTIRITYSLTSDCTFPPIPGNSVATPSSACVGAPITLSLQNSQSIGLMNYQWYNTNGAIVGATNETYNYTISNSDVFYCKVTCINSGLTANSNNIPVLLQSFYNCYCSSASTYSDGEKIYNLALNGWPQANFPSPFSNYNGPYGCNTIAPGPGSIQYSYSNFKTIPNLNNMGDISTISKNYSCPFIITENECDAGPYSAFGAAIWIDYNQNGSFNDIGEQVFVESTTAIGPRDIFGSFTIPTSAKLGVTALRVMVVSGNAGASILPCGNYDYGETEDYLINITSAQDVAPYYASASVTLGGIATGIGGSISYSIGQAAYKTYTNTGGSINQGIQQAQSIRLYMQVRLSGPLGNDGVMIDSLRAYGMIPATEPYSSPPFSMPSITEASGETVLNSAFPHNYGAVIDWVYIELRSAFDSSIVVATKRALLLNNGNVVSHLDWESGIAPVTFERVPTGYYYVSVKHRNHLGVMTASPVFLSTQFNVGTNKVDFITMPNVYTRVLDIDGLPIINPPRKSVLGAYALWAGDANHNNNVKYNGPDNDKDAVLNALGGINFSNNILYDYKPEDVNMDGKIKYNNIDNDRNFILSIIGISTPNNMYTQHTPN